MVFVWALLLVGGLLLSSPASAQSTTTCSAADAVLPLGAFATSTDDPLIPTYCVPDAPVQPPTRVNGANDWVDNFGVTGTARFNDGDGGTPAVGATPATPGYRMFESIGGIGQTKRMIVGDHWIDDNQQRYSGGTMMRPDRTFHFEQGKLVVEADFAAGRDVFGGNAWGEFIVVPADHPDINPPYAPEQEYAYGRFHGFPAFGCRIQSGDFVCAGFNGQGVPFQPTADRPPCFSLDDGGLADPIHYGIRLWELSFFQQCGSNFPGGVHYDIADGTNRTVFRSCPPGSDYDPCFDRFRLELTASSMVWYVNGVRMFEDSGWDTLHQLTNLLNAGPVYVYFADWDFAGWCPNPPGTCVPPASVRFHWGRLAINPHNPDGTFMAPSASPSFGTPVPTPVPTVMPTLAPTQPPTAIPTSTPTNTLSPSMTPTATPSATATLVPTATATATSAPPTPTATATPLPCEVEVWLNGVAQGRKPC